MMRCFHWLLIAALLGAAAAACRARPASPRDVVVLANSMEPESVELAKWYAAKRGIPVQNIALIAMPSEEGIHRDRFTGTILKPFISWLARNGWMRGQHRGEDSFEVFGHRVGFLVLMRGVPLRVEHDGRQMSWDEQMALPPNQFRAASVDSELALIPMGDWTLPFAIKNPLFEVDEPSQSELQRVFRVTRLDGPTAEDVRRMIDGGLEAERRGLAGRAYVDTGGPIAEGDTWFEDCIGQLRSSGFEVSVNGPGGMFSRFSRFDAPALYFGWYGWSASGPFSEPGMQLAPGAIAFHLHSFSAETVRSVDQRWVGPLVARGASVTFGNVAEPRMNLTQRPQLLLRKLREGWCLGDAAAFATPVLSWQAVVLGDPLYRPFRVASAEQVRRAAEFPEPLGLWVRARAARLELAKGAPGPVFEALVAEERTDPSLELTLEVARLQEAAGKPEVAVSTLAKLAAVTTYTPKSWRVAYEASQTASKLGDRTLSVAILGGLIGERSLGIEERIWLLEKAIPMAEAAGDAKLKDRWKALLVELRPPPPPAPAAPKAG